MTAHKETGRPAFPHRRIDRDESGMTLRDYFAAKAMQGLLAMESAAEYVDEETGLIDDDIGGTLFAHTKFLAREAYLIADNMLKARNDK